MSKKTSIINPHNNVRIYLPPHLLRLCGQCLNPMPVNYYRWNSETEVTIMFLCSHKGTSRFKRVDAKLDKKGRLV